MSRKFLSLCQYLFRKNQKLLNPIKPSFVLANCSPSRKPYSTLLKNVYPIGKVNFGLNFLRDKHKGGNKNRSIQEKHFDDDDDDDDDESEDDDDEFIKGSEVKTLSLDNLRVDLVLKAGLGYNRKKIEEHLYQNKLRHNGKKIIKKAVNVKESDEIDLIKNISSQNPNFLNIGRIEILSIKYDEDTDKFLVKVRKSKSLLIENYPDSNKYREMSSGEEA